MRPTFLKIAKGGVENEKKPDDRGLDELAHRKFERDRPLQHPGNRRPELLERPTERMRAYIRDRVGTERLTPSIRLCTGQPDRGACVRDFRRRPNPRLFVSSSDRHRQEPN